MCIVFRISDCMGFDNENSVQHKSVPYQTLNDDKISKRYTVTICFKIVAVKLLFSSILKKYLK